MFYLLSNNLEDRRNSSIFDAFYEIL